MRKEVKIFFRSFALTSLIVICVSLTYLGICRVYEAMRVTLFEDTRSAVILGEGYIKFFDKEIYF